MIGGKVTGEILYEKGELVKDERHAFSVFVQLWVVHGVYVLESEVTYWNGPEDETVARVEKRHPEMLHEACEYDAIVRAAQLQVYLVAKAKGEI